MGVFNGSETLEKYEAILKSSIDHFNDAFGRRESDFSALGTVFASMIETMEDPPLEFIWFYSALAFRSSRLTHQEPSRKFLIIKDLFDSVQWCSKSCNGLSKISALAPIMYILCSYSKGGLCLMGEEIEGFVKGIVGYISTCCVNDLRQKEIVLGSDMVVDFLDLIRVWTADKVGESCELMDAIRLFFPLLSDEIRHRVVVGCGMRFLAGVVMAEFLLWWLCSRVSSNELRSDMQTLMAQIVKEFQNSYFHGEKAILSD